MIVKITMITKIRIMTMINMIMTCNCNNLLSKSRRRELQFMLAPPDNDPTEQVITVPPDFVLSVFVHNSTRWVNFPGYLWHMNLSIIMFRWCEPIFLAHFSSLIRHLPDNLHITDTHGLSKIRILEYKMCLTQTRLLKPKLTEYMCIL